MLTDLKSSTDITPLPHRTYNFIMTSSNGNIFRVTGRLCGEFTVHRSPVNSPHNGQWRGALVFSLICAWTDGWANNRDACDLRRHRAHYDVTVTYLWFPQYCCCFVFNELTTYLKMAVVINVVIWGRAKVRPFCGKKNFWNIIQNFVQLCIAHILPGTSDKHKTCIFNVVP